MTKEKILCDLLDQKANDDNTIGLNAYSNGILDALEKLKALEMLEMLKKVKSELSRIKGSVMAHPDCIEGSEFDDYTNSAEEVESEIEQLIKEATGTNEP